MIDSNQRPIDGVASIERPKRPFLGAFSATQPHKGNRIIDEIWWTRWDSNHVRSLGNGASNQITWLILG